MSLKGYKGVIHGAAVQELFEQAKKHQFALPAVNVTGTNTINAVMETAKAVNSPVIIQLSNGGAQFYAGKTLNNDNLQACVLGAVSAAKHVHLLAEHYGIAVILHTDHAAKKLLPWIDGLLDHGEKFFAETGKPLFSSHMLDLSEEPIEENIEISAKYLERMSKLGMTIEIELGVTGGEEDGVDNSDVSPENILLTRDHRSGGRRMMAQLIDLPGIYDLSGYSEDERVVTTYLETQKPDLILFMMNASQVDRQLTLLSQVTSKGIPMVMVMNMADEASALGITIKADVLRQTLGIPVCLLSAKYGQGTEQLQKFMREGLKAEPAKALSPLEVEAAFTSGVMVPAQASHQLTERIDKVLLHPWLGLPIFFAVMLLLFEGVFAIGNDNKAGFFTC